MHRDHCKPELMRSDHKKLTPTPNCSPVFTLKKRKKKKHMSDQTIAPFASIKPKVPLHQSVDYVLSCTNSITRQQS